MAEKEDVAISRWVKSYPWYLHIIPLSEGNVDCGVGLLGLQEGKSL